MIPSKKALVEALGKTHWAYYTETGYNKSLELEVCKVYKGDCSQCFWSAVFPLSLTKFPCENSTIPPMNPTFEGTYWRRKLILDIKVLIKSFHYSSVRYRNALFVTKLNSLIKKHENQKNLPTLSK